jgi:dihydroorotate dehydrogenase
MARMINPYQLLRPLLFQLDPETAHQLAIGMVRGISNSPPLQKIFSPLSKNFFTYESPMLSQRIWGLTFNNPIGLAAGFDKNGEGIGAWELLGFGFAEIGTITAHPQAGNPRPRLFRIVNDRAILNRMGFNNLGAEVISAHLHQYLAKNKVSIPIGINLGKSKITPLERAGEDYLTSFQLCQAVGNYFVVNVSSPNTQGLRSLQNPDPLRDIIRILQSANCQQKPILVKIAPDLSWPEIDQVLQVCQDEQIAGIIATNTTIDRGNLRDQRFQQEAGGISGQPLQTVSTQIIQYIYKATAGRLPIIGVGGINSPESAWEKISAGAVLIQIYTGLVYEGLGLNRSILQGLRNNLVRQGIPHLSQLVGSGVPYSPTN